MEEKSKQLLLKTAAVIRQLKSERDWLVDQLATHMHKESASKFAKELVERGIFSQDEIDEKVEKISGLKDLKSVQAAVDIVHQPKTDLSIGSVEKVATADMSQADRRMTEDPAIQYLLGCI